MESDDEDDTVWIPIKDNGEDEMDWWVAEMLKKGDKYYCSTFEINGEIKYHFIPWCDEVKKEVAGIEKTKSIHQKINEDKINQMVKKAALAANKPRNTVSLAKSIGNKWRSFKKKVLFSPPRESLNPAIFLKSSEFRELLESTVQVAVERSIKEVTDKFSSIIKKLEEDLEKQQELVKKLEEGLRSDENVPKEEPMEPENLKVQKMEPEELEEKSIDSEEAELKKRRRTLVMTGVPEICSDSDHDKNLADIESVDRILKELKIETIPVSVYRMGEQKKDGEPRLLKVVMPTGHDQREVLRRPLKMKIYHGYGPIRIRPSLSTE